MSTGSIWRKWDLHVHPPGTNLNDGYDLATNANSLVDFCRKLHESDVIAFGITDYFSVARHFEFLSEYKRLYPNSGKVFFPNIELRLDVSVNKAAEEVNLHVIFDSQLDRSKIERFLHELKISKTINGARVSCIELEPSEYVSACVNQHEVLEKLHEVFGDMRPFLILAAANNAGIRADSKSPRKRIISDEIDKISDGFFGGSQNVEWFLSANRYDDSSSASIPKPVFSGSDAHSFDDLDHYLGKRCEENGQIHKDITWIKADLTFEGLRQVFFEPAHRVKIGEARPPFAPKRITRMNMDYPENVIINRTGTEPSTFCFAGVRIDWELSPFLTCVTGGRGTGKSTLLNVLVDVIRSGASTTFNKENTITPDGSNVSHSDFVQVDHSAEGLEFLEQNEIEEYATNPRKFTDAIYDRIRRRNSHVAEKELAVTTATSEVEDIIRLLVEKQQAITERRRIVLSLDSNKKVSATIEGDDYKTLNDSVTESNRKLVGIRAERTRLERLRDDVNELLKNHPPVQNNEDSSHYLVAYNEFLKGLSQLHTSFLSESIFDKEIETENKLQTQHRERQDELGQYLEGIGVTPENIEDIKNSGSLVDSLSAELDDIDSRISMIDDQIEEHDESKLQASFNNLVSVVTNEIGALKSVLENVNRSNPNEIDRIELNVGIDEETATENLFARFIDHFGDLGTEFNYRSDRVKECLFGIDPKALIDESVSIDDLRNHVVGDTNSRRYLAKVFADEINFSIYKHLARVAYFDFNEVIRVNVRYRGRPIEASSFGQRCTTVIVILLLFGNNPIIIDEPEAHLDSSLIANYLVDLIKEKKSSRQMIFATHNANIVVNADAELTTILSMPEAKTNVDFATIEDLSHRNSLLNLEGGVEAFEKRERKYALKEST